MFLAPVHGIMHMYTCWLDKLYGSMASWIILMHKTETLTYFQESVEK